MKKTLFIALIFLSASAGYGYAAGEGWVVAKGRQTGYDFTGYSVRPDVTFVFEEESFKLDKPCLVKASDVWVPAEEFLKKINIMFMKTDEDSFGIIRDDGTPLELKVGVKTVTFNKAPFFDIGKGPAIYEGTFMVSLNSLSKLLDTPLSYDEGANTVEISSRKVEEMETFTIPKPKEAEKKEVIAPPPSPRVKEPTDIREEFLPAQYRREVDIHLPVYMSYLEDKAADDRIRQIEWNPYGRILDYDITGQFRMKDFDTPQKERFKQSGEFLSIYGKNVMFKFFDNFASIPTLRSQSQAYFGGEVTHFYDPYRTTFVWGRTDNTVAGPADVGSVRYYGDLKIIKTGYTNPAGVFKTSETFIYWQNDAANAGQVATTIFPRRNLAFITENTFTPRPGLNLNFSYGLSNFVPDNKLNASFMDCDWKIGTEFRQPLYSASIAYEHVGDQYVSFGLPETYQDYEGLDMSTNFRFTSNWSFSIAAQVYRNNVERNPRVQTNFSRNLTLSTSVALPWEQNVNLSYNINEYVSRGGDVDGSGNRYQDYRVDYSKMWGNMNAQLSYDHYNLDAFQTATGGTMNDLLSLSLFNVYPEINNSYLRFYQSYRKTKTIADASYTTEYGDTSISGRLNVTRYLSQNIDWRVSYTLREAFTDTAMMTLTLGTEFQSSPVTTFNFDFNLSNWDLYNRKTWLPKHYTMAFRLRHTFDAYSLDKWGMVNALVYKDVNGNNKRDEGEPGIKDVRVYVAKGRSKFTDEWGRAVIKEVVPGDRQVKVDLSTLPLEYVVRGYSVVPATVKSMLTTYVEFPIVKTGNIRGRVYIDNNEDGQFDKLVDDAVPNVRIFIDPAQKETLTLSDGSYYLDFAYPGGYDVCLDLDTIPSGTKIKKGDRIPVALNEGETIKDVDFALSPRPIDVQYVGE